MHANEMESILVETKVDVEEYSGTLKLLSVYDRGGWVWPPGSVPDL